MFYFVVFFVNKKNIIAVKYIFCIIEKYVLRIKRVVSFSKLKIILF